VYLLWGVLPLRHRPETPNLASPFRDLEIRLTRAAHNTRDKTKERITHRRPVSKETDFAGATVLPQARGEKKSGVTPLAPQSRKKSV